MDSKIFRPRLSLNFFLIGLQILLLALRETFKIYGNTLLADTNYILKFIIIFFNPLFNLFEKKKGCNKIAVTSI